MNMMISYQELVRTFPNSASVKIKRPVISVATMHVDCGFSQLCKDVFHFDFC